MTRERKHASNKMGNQIHEAVGVRVERVQPIPIGIAESRTYLDAAEKKAGCPRARFEPSAPFHRTSAAHAS